MKRSDIRNGTIITILFSIIAFCSLFLIRREPAATVPQIKITAADMHWADTLNNRNGSHPALLDMERAIGRFMSKWEIKGMSLAIVRHDSLVYARGFGYADLENGIPMETSNIMRIASASKLVTATAIMKLIEEGKLKLDDVVFGDNGILNDTSYTNAIRDPRILDITVDHLLQHKGGFTLGAGDPMFNTADIMDAKHLDTPPDHAQLIRIVLGRRIGFAPGSGRRYSNFGYMLLSEIIERTAGTTYWEYVRQNILAPAGANMFEPATNYYEERHPSEARYYGPDTVKVREYNGSGRMVDRVYGGSDVHGLAGAGGWVASAPALARLAAAVDGRPEVPDILSAESVRLMTETEEKDKRLRGWSESDGRGRLSRTGTLGSTHALIQMFPDGTMWVAITNSGVWTGFHFSHDLYRLIEGFRQTYGPVLPRRTLW